MSCHKRPCFTGLSSRKKQPSSNKCVVTVLMHYIFFIVLEVTNLALYSQSPISCCYGNPGHAAVLLCDVSITVCRCLEL